jgi:hypothetical protein
VVASNALRELTGVRVIGPQGMVGLLATAGGAFLLGPGAIIPVFVTSAVIGDIAVKHREASPAEQGFAAQVFRDTLPWDRILLTNLSGANGRAFVCPNIDGQILVNLGGHLFGAPVETLALDAQGQPKDWVPGQTFIHELVHAWQIAHGALDAGFLLQGIVEQVTKGSSAYKYGPPGPPFTDFGLEGQAAMVEHWFAGRPRGNGTFEPRMSEADPYFRYIQGNIRVAQR